MCAGRFCGSSTRRARNRFLTVAAQSERRSPCPLLIDYPHRGFDLSLKGQQAGADKSQEGHSPVEVSIVSMLVKADASGVVTLPVELCREAGIAAGGEVVAEVQDGKIVLQRPRRPIWEEILELTKDIPPEEFDKLPPGGAAGIDDYLYGRPNRPE